MKRPFLPLAIATVAVLVFWQYSPAAACDGCLPGGGDCVLAGCYTAADGTPVFCDYWCDDHDATGSIRRDDPSDTEIGDSIYGCPMPELPDLGTN